MKLTALREYQIYENVQGYSKHYPGFIRYYRYENPVKMRVSGYEERGLKPRTKSNYIDPASLLVSLRRTKTTISDIVICNNFEIFVTFTFKSDRQDILKCKRKMSKWLKNQKERVGSFSYLIVPEFHKDGKSLHFHALIKGYQGKLVDSGKRINGRRAFNLKSYKLGFSSAVYIDDHAKVSSYVRKYITKDMPQFNNKKRFWCSTGLARPQIVRNPQIMHEDLRDECVVWRTENLTVFEFRETISLPLTAIRSTTWQRNKKLARTTQLQT